MYVCMYVCVYNMYVCVCMNVYKYECMHAKYVCNVCLEEMHRLHFVFEVLYVCLCVFVCVYVCVCVCVCLFVFKILFLSRSKTTPGVKLPIDPDKKKSHIYSDLVFVEWNHSQNDELNVALQHRTLFLDVIVSQVITYMCSYSVGRYEIKILLTILIY